MITWLDIGGAQENTLLCCHHADASRFEIALASGTKRGDPGGLAETESARSLRPIVVRGLRQEMSPLRDVVALVQLVRIMRRWSPDVVHTHSSKAGVLGRLAAFLLGVPSVHTVHGWSFNDQQPVLLRHAVIVMERLLAMCTAVIAVQNSQDLEAGVRRGIAGREKYRLVRSGVELGSFREASTGRDQLRGTLGLRDSDLVVGSVTRLARQKDPRTLVKAFSAVLSAEPNAALVVVGGGPLRDEVARLVESLGLSSRVHLLGTRRDVPQVLGAFDVFALSSQWEGLPRVLPEAMAAGVPVVATEVNGVPDVITHDVNGLLVPPSSPDLLADAILRILSSKALSERLTAAAADVVDDWSAERMGTNFGQVYDEVLQ